MQVTQTAGSVSIALGSSIDLPGAGGNIGDSGGNPILGLLSSGLGNYVVIANDTTPTTPPAGPVIAVTGLGTGAIPLRLSDRANGGIELNANGGMAMKVTSSTATPSTFASVNATPSGTFAGDSGVQVSPANATATGDISLVLRGQNNGSVYLGSNVDLAASALFLELPADPTTGVAVNRLAYLNSSGNAIYPIAAQRPVLGIALATTTSSPAMIAYSGKVLCIFENAITPGDYVVQGTTHFAQCRDGGSTYSGVSGVQILGTVLDSSGNILLRMSN